LVDRGGRNGYQDELTLPVVKPGADVSTGDASVSNFAPAQTRQSSVYSSQKLPVLGREVPVPTSLDFPLACKWWHLAQSSHCALHFGTESRILLRDGVWSLVADRRDVYLLS